MKKLLFTAALSVVAVMLCLSGCTQPSPPATPTPTALPGTQATIPPAGMGTPGPTQVLPPETTLVFQVTSNGNTVNPLMYVSLQGGQGINVDSQVEVTLTQPDGTTQTQYMNQPFSMGQTLTFPCSPVQNRIEIWVVAPPVGKTKVYDKIVPFQSINPY